MSNYNLKSLVIESGLVGEVNRMSKAFYKQGLRNSLPFPEAIKDGYRDMSIEDAIELYNTLVSSSEGVELLQECVRVNHANNARKNRVQARVKLLLEKPCVFLTFTFSDDTFSRTSPTTRRRYVRQFLDNYGAYVANIDFGSQNGREHYHAILQTSEKIDYTAWCKNGALNGQRIIKPNSQALSKYISKLVNHAIKETTHGCRIIYSK